MSVLKYWDQASGTYKVVSGPAGPAGVAYVVVSTTPPSTSSPVITPPAGLLWADTSVPDPTTQYLQLTGGTLSGNLTISVAAGNDFLTLSGPAGTSRSVFGQTAGNYRWQLDFGSNTAESGSNAGSDFVLSRYSDAAAYVDSPLSILRSSGDAYFTGKLNAVGGTLTGPLSVATDIDITGAAGTFRLLQFITNPSLRRWAFVCSSAAESGSNAGSDFQINRYNDAGTTIDTPLSINRASGAVTINPTAGTTTVLTVKGNPGTTLAIDKVSSGNAANLTGMMGGLNRWVMTLGNNAAEGGSNSGSDFTINRSNDAGTYIDTPLTINRASGLVTFADNISIDNSTASLTRLVLFKTSGSIRWIMGLAAIADTGGNAGSDFILSCYSDGGPLIAQAISAKRSTGVCTFSAAIVNGPSDRSLKSNIAPLQDSLDKVLALQGVSFNMIGQDKRQIGFIAQDVEPIVPEIIQDYQSADQMLLALDYPKLTALLVEALKELTARVATLEAGP